jgi:hypothetical protein
MFPVLFVGLLVTAASAFGLDLRSGHYVGGGNWKGADGTKGKWSSATTIHQTKSGTTVKEKLTIATPDGKKEVEEVEWTAVPKANGFFTTLMRGKEVGSGYCHRNQCHVEFTKADSKSEETFTFVRGLIFRLGSDTGAKYSVSWQGSMRKSWRRQN